jgi:hypothetical protein
VNIASIEKLAIERADQRTEEVFGLLLSLVKRSVEAELRRGCRYELTISGQVVHCVQCIELNFNHETLNTELKYIHEEVNVFGPEGPEDERTCTRTFDFVTTYDSGHYMDICFDDLNYLRIWK